MKKTYICPMIKVVKVGVILMTQTSIGMSETHYDGSSDIQTRRSSSSLWDDDEE